MKVKHEQTHVIWQNRA